MKTTTTSLQTTLKAVAVAVAALTLVACASSSPTPDAEAIRLKANHEAPKAEDFPDLDDAVWKQGSFVNLGNLRSMNKGLGKDQVRELLGFPHFSEGMFGSNEWNYIFHLRNAQTTAAAGQNPAAPEFVTCQYMVRFEKDANNTPVSTGMYWKGPDCAARVYPVAAVAVPAPVAAVAPVKMPERVTLGADALFAFGKAGKADILPAGLEKVRALAQSLKTNFKRIDYIIVTGHTDRLGSDADNLALSEARAQTIRSILIEQGIDGKLVRAVGMGERQPLNACDDLPAVKQRSANPELIKCLQPNRRVELEVAGQA